LILRETFKCKGALETKQTANVARGYFVALLLFFVHDYSRSASWILCISWTSRLISAHNSPV